MKKQGKCAKVIIAGCLAQRYKEELLRELPEADMVIGTGEIGRISEICEQALAGKERLLNVPAPAMVYGLPRISTTPAHYRYLKIAEGCSNRCSYCAIPAHPRELHQPAVPVHPGRGAQARRRRREGTRPSGPGFHGLPGRRGGSPDAPESAGSNQGDRMGAPDVRVSRQDQRGADDGHGGGREDLQVPRHPDPALRRQGARSHEPARDIGRYTEDHRAAQKAGARHCASHIAHCRLSRRDRCRVQAAALVHQGNRIRAPRRVHVFS